MKMKNKKFLEKTFKCEDDSILYFTFYPEERWIGFTILNPKYLKKRSGWQHLLFTKETMIRLLNFFDAGANNKTEFFECDCLCEVLRVSYDDKYGEYYLDIFDNYAFKLKSKGIRTSTYFSKAKCKDLQKILKDILKFI